MVRGSCIVSDTPALLHPVTYVRPRCEFESHHPHDDRWCYETKNTAVAALTGQAKESPQAGIVTREADAGEPAGSRP
jgi:hypothetical protein